MKNRKILTSLVALMMVFSALVFVGCNAPSFNQQHTSCLVFPTGVDIGTGTNYTINGIEVSDDYWAVFVAANKSKLTANTYGSRESWGNEDLTFTANNYKLTYSYVSSFGSYSGEVIGVDDSLPDGKNGFVFLIKTADNHSNYTAGTCSGAPSSFDDTAAHSCYLPIYFAYAGETLLNGAYAEMEGYTCTTACFYNKADAIAHGKYSSEIYGGAATYAKVTE